MIIHSLNDAMEILQGDTPIAKLKASLGEDISIDSILDDAAEYFLDSELAAYLSDVIKDIGYTKGAVLEKANIDEVTGFQIFSGITHPTFNTLLRICVAATFTLTETQKAIELAGYAPLNSNNERDRILMHCIMYMKSISEVNSLLYEANVTLL